VGVLLRVLVGGETGPGTVLVEATFIVHVVSIRRYILAVWLAAVSDAFCCYLLLDAGGLANTVVVTGCGGGWPEGAGGGITTMVVTGVGPAL
jgi:hypothetical protein